MDASFLLLLFGHWPAKALLMIFHLEMALDAVDERVEISFIGFSDFISINRFNACGRSAGDVIHLVPSRWLDENEFTRILEIQKHKIFQSNARAVGSVTGTWLKSD